MKRWEIALHTSLQHGRVVDRPAGGGFNGASLASIFEVRGKYATRIFGVWRHEGRWWVASVDGLRGIYAINDTFRGAYQTAIEYTDAPECDPNPLGPLWEKAEQKFREAAKDLPEFYSGMTTDEERERIQAEVWDMLAKSYQASIRGGALGGRPSKDERNAEIAGRAKYHAQTEAAIHNPKYVLRRLRDEAPEKGWTNPKGGPLSERQLRDILKVQGVDLKRLCGQQLPEHRRI